MTPQVCNSWLNITQWEGLPEQMCFYYFSLDSKEAREGQNIRSVGREFQTLGAW